MKKRMVLGSLLIGTIVGVACLLGIKWVLWISATDAVISVYWVPVAVGTLGAATIAIHDLNLHNSWLTNDESFVLDQIGLVTHAQRRLDEELLLRAGDCRESAELRLRLEQYGVAGFAHTVYRDRSHMWIEQDLVRRMTESKAGFHDFYDEAARVNARAERRNSTLRLKLKERSWKKYAGEPALPKLTQAS